MESYNLCEQSWIATSDGNLCSLYELARDPKAPNIGGGGFEQISLNLFLLAVAQKARGVIDRKTLMEEGPEGLREAFQHYLEQEHQSFDLYGNNPFLQDQKLASFNADNAPTAKYGVSEVSFYYFFPNSGGASSPLHQSYQVPVIDDRIKATKLIQINYFGHGTKAASHLRQSSRTSPTPGKAPYLTSAHALLRGETFWDTIWFNFWDRDAMEAYNIPDLGVASWELEHPAYFEDVFENAFTLLGRLAPLTRITLLRESDMLLGVPEPYPSPRVDLWRTPTGTLQLTPKGDSYKPVMVSPRRRPFRDLEAMMSGTGKLKKPEDFEDPSVEEGVSLQVSIARHRLYSIGRENLDKAVTVVCVGARLNSTAGEDLIGGHESDEVLSQFSINAGVLLGIDEDSRDAFRVYGEFLGHLDKVAKILYAACGGYETTMSLKAPKKPSAIGGSAVFGFWDGVEPHAEEILTDIYNDICDSTKERRRQWMKHFVNAARVSYGSHCSRDTARQISAWAQNQPVFSLKGEAGELLHG